MEFVGQEVEEDVPVGVCQLLEVGVHVLLGHCTRVASSGKSSHHFFAYRFPRRHEIAVAEPCPVGGFLTGISDADLDVRGDRQVRVWPA